MSYDRKCYKLAEDFLADYDIVALPNLPTPVKQVTGHLAQMIQDSIDDEIAEMLDDGTLKEALS